jgi:hypothetical protein
VCLLAFVIIGCGLSDQSDEANKINSEVNDLIVKYNENNKKKDNLYNKLFVKDLKGVTDLKEFKKEHSEEFDELTKSIESQLKLSKEIAEKYAPILNLQISEKFKEYAKTTLDVRKKGIEVDQEMLNFVKIFLETDDIDKVNELMKDRDKQIEKFNKELEDLDKKTEQIKKDNPDDIK